MTGPVAYEFEGDVLPGICWYERHAARIETFGCRLNTYESEVMRATPRRRASSNAIVFNTCAVTAEATRQARQAIRRAQAENPEAEIIVTGCAAQTEAEMFAKMPEVDARPRQRGKAQAESWRRAPRVAVVRHHAR
jgi:threonylcarbamoyladenosine tRNA methylthiotransferase MtaB